MMHATLSAPVRVGLQTALGYAIARAIFRTPAAGRTGASAVLAYSALSEYDGGRLLPWRDDEEDMGDFGARNPWSAITRRSSWLPGNVVRSGADAALALLHIFRLEGMRKAMDAIPRQSNWRRRSAGAVLKWGLSILSPTNAQARARIGAILVEWNAFKGAKKTRRQSTASAALNQINSVLSQMRDAQAQSKADEYRTTAETGLAPMPEFLPPEPAPARSPWVLPAVAGVGGVVLVGGLLLAMRRRA